MGCCHTSEFCFVEISEELNTLIEENLLLLKSAYLHFISTSNPAVALKVLNVYKITSQHYCTVKSDRESVLALESTLCLKVYKQLEKSIEAEETQLKAANEVLLGTFKSLRKLWLKPSLSKVQKYITDTESIYKETVDDLDCLLDKAKDNNESVDSVAMKISNGETCDDALLKDICKVTTYVINNKEKRVTYPRKPTKRSELTPGEAGAARKNTVATLQPNANEAPQSKKIKTRTVAPIVRDIVFKND